MRQLVAGALHMLACLMPQSACADVSLHIGISVLWAVYYIWIWIQSQSKLKNPPILLRSCGPACNRRMARTPIQGCLLEEAPAIRGQLG